MKRLSAILVTLVALMFIGCEKEMFDYNDPVTEDATESVTEGDEDNNDEGNENEDDQGIDAPGDNIGNEDGVADSGEGDTCPGEGKKTTTIKRIGKPTTTKYPRPLIISDKRTDHNTK